MKLCLFKLKSGLKLKTLETYFLEVIQTMKLYVHIEKVFNLIGFSDSMRPLSQQKFCNLTRSWLHRITHFGRISHPWPMMDPIVNQIQLCMFQIFSNSSASWLQGWLASQSSGAMLFVREEGKKNFIIEISAVTRVEGEEFRFLLSNIYRARTNNITETPK